jgi:hypothetical protein
MGSAGFFPLTLLSIVFVFASCSRVLGADEGYNADPCLALYHPEVLAEKARPLGALSTWSDPTPHNYRPKARAFDAKKVDCRVYHAMLGFNELPVAESDAFAIEVARPFFADASTAEVLHLELQNILPRKGKITVSYDIRRADLGGRHEAPALPPSSGLPYRLSEVSLVHRKLRRRPSREWPPTHRDRTSRRRRHGVPGRAHQIRARRDQACGGQDDCRVPLLQALHAQRDQLLLLTEPPDHQ